MPEGPNCSCSWVDGERQGSFGPRFRPMRTPKRPNRYRETSTFSQTSCLLVEIGAKTVPNSCKICFQYAVDRFRCFGPPANSFFWPKSLPIKIRIVVKSKSYIVFESVRLRTRLFSPSRGEPCAQERIPPHETLGTVLHPSVLMRKVFRICIFQIY